MTNAKRKFDKTILRCKEQIQLYERLKNVQEEHPEMVLNVSQDILRGAIVLSVAAFDAYATDCFCEMFVPYIKKRGVDDSLIELLNKAGFDIKFAIELIESERPYRKIRTLIEKYYATYTTQRLYIIDELFLQFHIKKITENAEQKSCRRTLLKSVEKIIQRRHYIVHDGDYNEFSRIKEVTKSDLKRIDDLVLLVTNMEDIVQNKFRFI